MRATGLLLKTTVVRKVAVLTFVTLLAVACSSRAPTEVAGDADVAGTPAVPTNEPAAEPVVTAPGGPSATPTSEPTVTPTTAPEPTARSIPEPVFDEALLAGIANEIDVQDGAYLFAVIDANGDITKGSNGTNPAGQSPTANDAFQIGSFTKVFTALATLTLVDDGLVELDAPVSDYVSRLAVPAEVTVRQLLQHTSGLFSYTGGQQFLAAGWETPSRAWMPEEVYEYVDDRAVLFAPGSRFSYSNTNYLILGVLIEEVTGRPYHHVMRDRIIDPLGMESTYLGGFENGPALFFAAEPNGIASYDNTAYLTTAWSSGAMVSTASDLHVLFNALFNYEIISEDLVAQMTQGSDVGSPYGFGLNLRFSFDGFYGHSGGFLGHLVLIHHAPESGITAFQAATDSRLFAPPGPYSRLETSRIAALDLALRALTPS